MNNWVPNIDLRVGKAQTEKNVSKLKIVQHDWIKECLKVNRKISLKDMYGPSFEKPCKSYYGILKTAKKPLRILS